MRTPLHLVLSLLQSACFSQDWTVVDQRGLGAASFWSTVADSQGPLTCLSHYPLSPTGRTQINVTTSVPVGDIKDLEVTAWVDASGTNECLDDCLPRDGDPVVKLSRRNWPYVYEIVFTANP